MHRRALVTPTVHSVESAAPSGNIRSSYNSLTSYDLKFEAIVDDQGDGSAGSPAALPTDLLLGQSYSKSTISAMSRLMGREASLLVAAGQASVVLLPNTMLTQLKALLKVKRDIKYGGLDLRESFW